MCGRTSLYAPREDLEERFDASVTFDYRPRYNVAPGEDLAVVANRDESAIVEQNWGLVPSWVEDPDDAPRPVNARAETVAEKPTFRDAFQNRRCLVLSSGFYEWRGERGSKQPYRVCRVDDAPFAMAGLWEQWGSGGDAVETVTVVTTDASDLVAPIHDRMPVVLGREDERDWLRAGPDEAASLLAPYEGDDLRAYPVSTLVNDPSNDTPEVLVEAEATEQSDLDEFAS